MLVLLKKVYSKLQFMYSLRKNISKCSTFVELVTVDSGNLFLRGADIHDLQQIESIYRRLNGIAFSVHNKKLLKNCPRKLLVIAEKEIAGQKQIVGMDLFYMNPRDFKEQTIHEGFIGVLPEHEGQGIATKMRKYAMAHFHLAGFSGISTRISKNNKGSLHSAEKLGFKLREHYFDTVMQEERYYLVLRFE